MNDPDLDYRLIRKPHWRGKMDRTPVIWLLISMYVCACAWWGILSSIIAAVQLVRRALS